MIVFGQTLIIDNNSPNNSFYKLKQFDSNIVVLKNTVNLGWGGALNTAFFSHPFDTDPEFFLTLNSDVVLDPECVEKLVNTIYTNSKIAALTPAIYDFNCPSKIQKSGFNMSFRFLIPTDIYKLFHLSPGRNQRLRIVNWVEDTVSLMRKNAIEKVKGYDEQFFMYGQMTDLAYRLNLKSYLVGVDYTAKAYHIGKGSSGEGFSEFSIYHKIRNWIIFHRKHFKGIFSTYLYVWGFFIGSVFTALFILSRRFRLIKPIFKGLRDGFSLKIKAY